MATVLLSVINLSALASQPLSDKLEIAEESIERNETGIKKEFILKFKATENPLIKKLFMYYDDKRIKEVIIYTWDNNTRGWEYCRKREYIYSSHKKLLSIIDTDWDRVQDRWSGDTRHMVYAYTDNGDLQSIRLHRVAATTNIVVK